MEQAEPLGIGVQEWSYEYPKIPEQSAVAVSTLAKITEQSAVAMSTHAKITEVAHP
jgi:hypothetical protein